ncbi:helix-turn-helix domain-containing protein [Belliella marina]|uniref:helix-turn-helix domain-containing protein n=1 Tax=Belliella marina TaxID=1644146 RepID=UPI00366D718C
MNNFLLSFNDMLAFELSILTITYTVLTIAIFLQVFCFKRSMEAIETIAFTVSLLLLVVSISLSPLSNDGTSPTITTLVCMVLVSVTTFLSTLKERVHAIPSIYKKIHSYLAFMLFFAVILSHWVGFVYYVEYSIVVFLVGSVVISMVVIRLTKPKKRYVHLEKSNRVFSLVFMVIVPLILVFHFGFEKAYENFPIDFLLYIGFTLLAISKIYDDLQRLSLINKGVEPHKRHFENYGLTLREGEIAALLSKGITYKAISDQLSISLPTVKTHAGNIYKKCSVKTRYELTQLLNS